MLRYYHPVARGQPRTIVSDVCVYGGTSAGIAAAVVARRLGRTASVAACGRHIGGLSASGLGATDTGRIEAIGGLAREFYRRIGDAYGLPESFRFEPHVAEQVFETWVAEHGVDVERGQRLQTVRMAGDRIAELEMESGVRFRARDVRRRHLRGRPAGARRRRAGPRAARATPRTGRRSTASSSAPSTSSGVPVDPYVVPGDPASGLLAGHLGRPARRRRRGRPSHPGLQLPRLPHARRQPPAVPEAGGLRPRPLRAAAALHRGRRLGRARQQPADAERQDRH